MYSVVNEALNHVFLGGRFESRPLYLVLDKRGRKLLADLLSDSVGDENEGIEEACCQLVGARLSRVGDPYRNFEVDLLKWQAAGRGTLPPFTALLFTLSRAAELMVSDGQFSSNNYYQRLAKLTGFDAQRLSLHGRFTEKYWKSFNNWLADSDFQFGRPSARSAFDGQRYVGLAMSQAIVREEDRQRFHDLFEKYGFTGTDAITEEEIAQYIANWICTSRPTRQLKAAWAKAELRPRICEAAVAELQEWAQESSQRAGASARGGGRLSVAVSFRQDLLGKTISVWFGREAEMEEACFPSTGSDEAAFVLSNSTFAGFATVEPRNSIDLVRVLSSGLDRRDNAGKTFTWSARAVIPLSRSEKGDYWTEVNRVTMGVDHLVLARSDKRVRDSVEAALEEVAEPGYTVATADRIKGLPAGWVIYEGVRVFRQLEQLDGFQSALSPVGNTSGLQVVGGLKIGQSIWHQERPPRVILDARSGSSRIAAWDGTSAEGNPICEADGASGHVALDLANCRPASGNLYIEGSLGAQVIGSASLLLRSAARPRPLDRQGRGTVGYRDAIQAVALVAPDESVRGLGIPATGTREVNLDLARFEKMGRTQAVVEDPGEAEDRGPQSSTPAISLAGLSIDEVRALPCGVRGLHVFVYETLPLDFPKSAPVNKQCRDCSLALLENRRKKPVGPKQTKPVRHAPSTPPYKPRESEDLSFDLWLDAACFWGNGSAASFEALVSAEGLDPWRAAEVLKQLSWLGHVDVELGQNWRPRSWSVAAPALSFMDTNLAVLAGFRNEKFIEDVEDLARCAGGMLERHTAPGSPETIFVRGLNATQGRSAFDVAIDPHGRHLSISEDGATRLLAFCHARGGIFTGLRPMTLANGGTAERFDLDDMRWKTVETTREPGAYRVRYAGTQYVFRSPSGKAYSGPHEVVKIAAARLGGARLHAYCETERNFISVLGCEPIGLLSRALVACSGILPTVADGLSNFTRVPPVVAAAILDLLYDGELSL